ncbi:hypothetical protein C8R46DRAFT_47256 [Mycena filopes]|nr:hypothetical protein C8R46DRAFT_47256 [Mycena filopes]
MTSSAKSSQTSPTFVAPQATNASHSPRTHRAAVIAGATVSAIALLGLIAVALTLLYRRYLRHKSLPTFRFGFHRNHSRRAFIVHSRGANYDDGDDDWKVESTFSPTTDTPGYFDAQLMTKTPHYIVHSESRRGSTVSGSSQVALWAATHLVQPVPLSPLSRPASPPADALQRMKSVTSSVGSEYSTESAVSRNRDPQFLGRLP